MKRTSDRQNKGKLPAHLKDFEIDIEKHRTSSNSSESEEDFDSTIVATSKEDKMSDEEELRKTVADLTTQLQEMRTAFTKKNSDLEQRNKDLETQIQATQSKVQNVRQTAYVSLPGGSANINPVDTNTLTNSKEVNNLSTPTTLSSSEIHTEPPLTRQNQFEHQYYSRKPLVPLPKFEGNPCEWPMFLAEYRRTSAEYNYSATENTSRLNDCLRGKARDLVQWLLIHNNMSEKVIERLQARFGRTDLLVEAQLALLREIPKINDSKLEQIVPFADKVVNFAHFMMSSNCEHQLSNPTLLNELVIKLPMSIRISWSTHSITLPGHPTILEFSEWIEKLADSIDRVPTGNAVSIQSSDRKPPTKKASVMYASEASSDHKPPTCVQCKGEHFIFNCQNFMKLSTDARWTAVKEKRLCFSCLKSNHSTKNCRRRKSCGQDGCTRIHHQLLHNTDPNSQQQASRPTTTVSSCNAISRTNSPRLLFKIVPVKLYGNNGTIQTYAFIDEGSSTSLINKSLVDKLGLHGPRRQLELQWFDNQKSVEESQAVKLKISGVHRASEIFELTGVCSVQNLSLPIQTLDVHQLHSKCQGLRNLPIQSYEEAKPEILLGLDHCYLGVSRHKTTANDFNGLIVSECPLGWIVYGKTSDEKLSTPTARVCHINESVDHLESVVNDYFTVENFGTQPTNAKMESKDDVRAMEILRSTTKRVGDRFESGLLWKMDETQLPDSFPMAMKRLVTVENKMKKDQLYSTRYRETIKDHLKKRYAKKLTTEEVAAVSPRTWYLPHFGVLNPNKPKKFRLVFDAAAAVEGTSLNSSLMSGPDLNQPLLSVLCKFRERRVGVCADIQEMFHQVMIREGDQDSQRFLWRNESTQKVEVYKMLVMTFGSTSSPSTAQFVKNQNALEFSESHPAAVEAIRERHYVDDYVHSFDEEAVAIQTTQDVKRIHKAGGFVLRGF